MNDNNVRFFFKDQLFHSSPFFSENNILKFGDKITLANILFVNKSINRQVPPIFYDVCIVKYGRCSIRTSTIYPWNSIQNLLIKNLSLKNSISKKRLNISLLNILLKSTNNNILGQSLQRKLQTYSYI